MNVFLETICLLDGIPRHLQWHQQRIENTFRYCIPHAEPFHLETELTLYDFPEEGKFKCSIHYSTEIIEVTFSPYPLRTLKQLKLVEIPPGFDYRFKYADRKIIDDLFSKKGNADDILMTRDGWIMDTSIANIAFRKNERWYTPSLPLLAGTTWKRLVSAGTLLPRPIHKAEIHQFQGFKIFNAMNDWGELLEEECHQVI
ncbi:MAG TPA: aminotransferase class IV [Saprospiraceae bacterium]|nr:aminotransferase class IV [Saprospiraceae bacterium]